MVYLISEMVISLIFSASIGFCIGWFVQGKVHISEKEKQTVKGDHLLKKVKDNQGIEKNRHRLEMEINTLKQSNQAKDQKIATLESQLNQNQSDTQMLPALPPPSLISPEQPHKDLSIPFEKSSYDMERINVLLKEVKIWEGNHQKMGEGKGRTFEKKIGFDTTLRKKRDGLKDVKGIGPVLENFLNEMGVNTYQQIAGFTKIDIDGVMARLPDFPEKIIWDYWVDQAKRLHFTIKRKEVSCLTD